MFALHSKLFHHNNFISLKCLLRYILFFVLLEGYDFRLGFKERSPKVVPRPLQRGAAAGGVTGGPTAGGLTSGNS